MREWGQLLAYLPEIRRLINDLGPSILFLPSPGLRKDSHTDKASQALGKLARELGISNQQIRRDANASVLGELKKRGEDGRFSNIVP